MDAKYTVKFLRDYRGRETKEAFVQAGQTFDIPRDQVKHLVHEEVIEKPADEIWQQLVIAEDSKKAGKKTKEPAGAPELPIGGQEETSPRPSPEKEGEKEEADKESED